MKVDAVIFGQVLNGAGLLARFHPDGKLDGDFGLDGRVTLTAADSRADVSFAALALQPDGKLLIGGTLRHNQEDILHYDDYLLARYRPDGHRDETFGVDGLSSSSFIGGSPFGSQDQIIAMALQPEGKLIAAAQVTYWAGAVNRVVNFAVARFTLGAID